MIRIARMACVLPVSLLLSGCLRMTVAFEPRTEEMQSTAAKNPLHAGIYYSPSFAKAEHERRFAMLREKVKIGEASIKVFDRVLPLLFEKVTPVANLSAEEVASTGVDLVLVPSLEHFDYRRTFEADNERYSVVYRTTIYSRRGVPVASWLVLGDAKSRSGFTVNPKDWLTDDVTEAGVNYLKIFHRETSTALATLASNPASPEAPIDAGKIQLTVKVGTLAGLEEEHLKALQKARIVSFQIAASHQERRSLLMRASDMRLKLVDGMILEPATLGSVVNALESTSHASWILGGFFISMVVNREEQKRLNAQFQILGDSVLGDRTLTRGKEEVGVVSFKLPKGVVLNDGARLAYWVVDPTNADGAQGEIAIPVLK